MKISTKGRYALKIMTELALNYERDEYISAATLATRLGISIKYLEIIIALLNKAGYLRVLRGSQGGYQLKKSPKEYIIGDILNKTEGELSPTYCLTDEGSCQQKTSCETYLFWKGLDDTINEYIYSKTLQDLIH